MEENRFSVTSDAPGFAPAPLRLLQDERIQSPTTIAVYVALSSFIDYGTATCFPSLRTIGKRTRCSADAAARHIELLVVLGYVTRISGKTTGRSNKYRLIDPWGREQGAATQRKGYRTNRVGGPAPAPDKRDPSKQIQKQRELLPRQVATNKPQPSHLLSRISAKLESQAETSPSLIYIKPVAPGGTTPCSAERLAQDDPNNGLSKPNSSLGKIEVSALPAKAFKNAPQPSHEVAQNFFSPLLERIKQEAQMRGAPPCFIVGGWASAVQALVASGVSAEEILRAFTACIETAPERVTFFPRDFLKWRKVSRTRGPREYREDPSSEERRERDRAREREQLLLQREDPYWQEQIAAAIAQLPWRRVRE